MMTKDQIMGAVERLQTPKPIPPKRPQISPLWREKHFPGMEAWHKDVSKAMKAAEIFVKRFAWDDPGGRRLMVIEGKTGTGKTMLGRFMRRFAASINPWPGSGLGVNAGLIQWPEIADLSVADRRDSADWENVVRWDFAVLDDVGAEIDQYKTGAPSKNLRSMLEERRRKWTVITTNVPQGQWLRQWDDRVERRLEDGVIVNMSSVERWNRRGA